MKPILDLRRVQRVTYFVRNSVRECLPNIYFQKQLDHLLNRLNQFDQDYIESRVNYYLKTEEPNSLSEKAISIKDFKLAGNGSLYYFDLKEFLLYFDSRLKFDYLFGDITYTPQNPAIVKSRPIHGDVANSVVLKLDKFRHFNFVYDSLQFSAKENRIIWRGEANQPHRKAFLEGFWDHPLCDVGQTNRLKENVPWQKSFMSIRDQLRYKFILCIEGNDVATNLKWAMSSNSLCMIPKMVFETWFMEGTLEAGKHYVELDDKYSDLDQNIRYYSKHTDEAEEIIANAHEHVAQFMTREREDIISLLVLKKYFELSGQEVRF